MLAFALFLIVLVLVITQPRGLQIGTTAVIGAAAVWALWIVHINDVPLAPKLHLRVYRAFLSNQVYNETTAQQ